MGRSTKDKKKVSRTRRHMGNLKALKSWRERQKNNSNIENVDESSAEASTLPRLQSRRRASNHDNTVNTEDNTIVQRNNSSCETNDLESMPVVTVKVEETEQEEVDIRDPLSLSPEKVEHFNASSSPFSHNRLQFDEDSVKCAPFNITELKKETLDIKEEVEMPCSPPLVVETRGSFSPDHGSSAPYTPNVSDVSEDDLKNLFNFLYKTVLKFPQHIQIQVKMDLYRTVAEAEMNWQCSLDNKTTINM